MNRSHITPEVIELAKRIYELGCRWEIQKGTWFIDQDGSVDLWPYPDLPEDINVDDWETFIPIPSLETALDWLRENVSPDLMIDTTGDDATVSPVILQENASFENKYTSTEKTLLESALSAIVKVLEAEKGGADEQGE